MIGVIVLTVRGKGGRRFREVGHGRSERVVEDGVVEGKRSRRCDVAGAHDRDKPDN